MKIAFIGYGKMGREVEAMLNARGHETVFVADENNLPTVDALRESGAEVAVEFTTPDTAFDNICMCLEARVAVVSGTTGWLARWDEAVAMCRKLGGAMFYASNYSIGVNIFFRMNEQLARMMERFPQYAPSMTEVHHIHKKDAPSGTAITLAEGLIANSTRIEGWELVEQAPIGENKIGIEAIRQDEVPGTHTVRWESEVDRITMTHEAFNRKGLAAGAATAAEFIHGKKGVFSMEDLLEF